MMPAIGLKIIRGGEVEWDTTVMKEGYVIMVEDGEILEIEAVIILPDREYKYIPKTLPIFFSVTPNGSTAPIEFIEAPARLRNGKYEAKTRLEVKRQWFISEKVKRLVAQYPGGDEVVYEKHTWKKLGRLGWLSKKTVREELEEAATYVNLAYLE